MSALGLLVILGVGLMASANRRAIRARPVIGGLLLQVALALLLFKTPAGEWFFACVNVVVTSLIDSAGEGASFVFGEGFREHFFAFCILSTVVFLSSLANVLFYCGILQRVIHAIAWVMRKTLSVSGAEALAGAANIFVGQIEAPLFIKASLPTFSRSQLYTVMVCGMATIAGSLLAVYAGLGIHAGHLLTATILSAPAAIVISKILVPDQETARYECVTMDSGDGFGENIVDAASRGAQQGLKVAFAIAACVLCFIAFTALVNKGLSACPDVAGASLSLERILGILFRPVAWVIGVPWGETSTVGMLLGKKLVFNEFVAYAEFAPLMNSLSPRTVTITTYALCGFSNISSVAIQIGGLGALVPERRGEIASLGFRALLGGTLATLMTACIAGLLT